MNNESSNYKKDKYIYSYISKPVKSYKEKKTNPTNQINKYVNKYNNKNKYYYNYNYSNNLHNCIYITNSDIYIDNQ